MKRTRKATQALSATVISALLAGCAWIVPKPAPLTQTERLAQFPSSVQWPIAKPVRIHWQENMVPFVDAETDADCAFAIGVVHAFLRLGQMEIFRRGSAGRLAESLGPVVAPDIDVLLRKLDLGRASDESAALLSASDREWLDRYLEGINFFIANTPQLPPEFALLALQNEPWGVSDSLRIAKLGSGDPNWGTLLGLLPLRDKAGWQTIWDRVLSGATQSMPSIPNSTRSVEMKGLDGFRQLLTLATRAGSNSLVVAGQRSASGAALIASDPHLGIFMPNLWLLMGYRSPSYEVVGYMLPGVPVVTLGRNPDIAWGGTAMRGISSHLFEVSSAQLTGTRKETIKVRGWFDREIEIAESRFGPVVFEGQSPETGTPQKVALSWTGHQPGNDLGAFLAANRAKNWESFREAFGPISGPSLNLTYADAKGQVGFLPGIRQPLLSDPTEERFLVKSSHNFVASYRSPLQLPSLINPEQGFIASANNVPVRTEPPLASPTADNGRKRRLDALASSADRVTATTLMEWQQDVLSDDALALRDRMLSISTDGDTRDFEVARQLRDWDGRYATDSSGAVAQEVLSWRLANALAARWAVDDAVRARRLAFDDWRLALAEELEITPTSVLQVLWRGVIPAAESEFKQYPTWGEWHVQRLQSPLGLLPVIGRRYRYGESPSPGGSSTVNKAGFIAGEGQRKVIFGAQVRHVSDMADPDENYFVMLGGNDGWLDNVALTDQVSTWRSGAYINIPLSQAGVARTFKSRTFTFRPKS